MFRTANGCLGIYVFGTFLIAALGVTDACAGPTGELCVGGAMSGDADGDGDRDLRDFARLKACLAGPDGGLGDGCECFTGADDSDVDLRDVARFFNGFSMNPECVIDGKPVAAGERDVFPFNCRVCDPAQDTTFWSLLDKGTLCNSGSGDVCDPPEFCNGITGMCPDDSFAPSVAVCRQGSGDDCDPPERCPGVPDQPCPEDVVSPKGQLCRAGSGDMCDPDEFCTGVSRAACPDDVLLSTDVVCRAGSGDMCDPDEVCPGIPGQGCPDDSVAKAGAVCNPGSRDLCDPDEVCSGVALETCPEDQFESSGVLCREVAGDCDVADFCSGNADEPCPDNKLGSETVCRAMAGACDVEETCDGVSSDCPPNGFKSAGTTCRNAGSIVDEKTGDQTIVGPGECDEREVCTGESAACPPDLLKSAGTLCRDRLGPCDIEQERCSGESKDCPFDSGTAGQTVPCRLRAGPCDVPEVCNQADDAYPGCPADEVRPAGTLCRDLLPMGPFPNLRACDEQEFCDGESVNCPADEQQPIGTECVRGDGGDGECADVGVDRPVCVAAGVVPNGGRCHADFECISGNCSEMIDRSMRCIPPGVVGYGGTCDGKDVVPEGDPEGRICYDGDSNKLWCCKGSGPAGTGETGTCKECCLTDAGSNDDLDVVDCQGPTHGSRTMCCSGRCTDTETDPRNCGECGTNCLDDESVCREFVECQPSNPDGLPEPGQCIYQSPCGDGNACWDSCVLSQDDSCQSVPSCVNIVIEDGTGLCDPCSGDGGCEDDQFCASGCGGDIDVSVNTICLDSGYCVREIGDCVVPD